MEISEMGPIQFALRPHVDSYRFLDDKLGTKSTVSIYSKYVDYTSLIYLNEIGDGGDLMFLDLPKPLTWPLPDDGEDPVKCEETKIMDCPQIYKDAVGVRVSPGPGKLTLFDSGSKNIHSILHLSNGTRLSLLILFAGMKSLDRNDLPSGHGTAFYYSTKQCYNVDG